MQVINQSAKTKLSWNKIKDGINNVDLYSIQEVVEQLQKDGLHSCLVGRGKNRTLMKSNPRLYKSIMEHTNHLEIAFKAQKSYKSTYSFTSRMRFILEKDTDLTKLRCKCGKKYTWTTYCRHCPDYKQNQLGRPHTEDVKQKMRLSALSYIKQLKGQVIPRYNKGSISIIESYGVEHGYTFMHAENGGEYFVKELGYFLDGYDPINNVAIEIDEKRHFAGSSLCDKDIERQKQIENLLGCKFIRLKYD